MSTCPELDLLSVYLDEELPRQYEQKLKDHLDSCEQCKNYYESLKSIHNSLREDSQKIVFSDAELDESFLRLKTKMNYKAVITPAPFNFAKISKWVMPIITAAAVFVAVFLPIRFSRSVQIPSITPGLNHLVTPVKMIQETGIAREASLYQTNSIPTTENFTSATIDIFRPELSETIRISINLNGYADYNSQTSQESVILPASFAVDVRK